MIHYQLLQQQWFQTNAKLLVKKLMVVFMTLIDYHIAMVLTVKNTANFS